MDCGLMTYDDLSAGGRMIKREIEAGILLKA